jgi:hypothetical protein
MYNFQMLYKALDEYKISTPINHFRLEAIVLNFLNRTEHLDCTIDEAMLSVTLCFDIYFVALYRELVGEIGVSFADYLIGVSEDIINGDHIMLLEECVCGQTDEFLTETLFIVRQSQ